MCVSRFFICTVACFVTILQAIWRQVQSMGLVDQYRNDPEIRKQVRQLMALAFAPVLVVRQTFSLLQQTSDPTLNNLFAYFSDQWLTRTPLPMWNVYRRQMRTNNDLEGWHSRFAHVVVRHHPNIWLFLSALQEEHDATLVSIHQAIAGHDVRRRYLPYDRIERRLHKLCRRYRHGSIDVIEYITAVSYNLAQF
jgi:hypothetical protein